jgi:hypothetical protein
LAGYSCGHRDWRFAAQDDERSIGNANKHEGACRVMPGHFDFLSVGEEFGADAGSLSNATRGTELLISRAVRRASLRSF